MNKIFRATLLLILELELYVVPSWSCTGLVILDKRRIHSLVDTVFA